jgi:cold shock CspA family protein
MNPRLRRHFFNFKQRFEIVIPDQLQEKDKILLESQAFEKFVNFSIFSLDYPDIFTADINLLNVISIGGGNDTGIDGIGVRVNDIIVRDIDEIREIIKEKNKRIEYDFIFIQSKMQEKFDASEFTTFAQGIEHFFYENPVLPENEKLKQFRKIKEFLDSEEVNNRIKRNPKLTIYYVSAGNPPTDQHFLGTKDLIFKKFNENGYYFEEVKIKLIDGKTLISFCDELENNFQVQLNILDSFPLLVGSNEDIKKAYAFTCTAQEYLKVLTKEEDDSLRKHLFNDNVRDYLGNKKEGSVNSEIEKSINENPEMFLLCNNGITIVCDDYKPIKDKLVQIDNPQIVNGCQTSNSIFNQKGNTKIQNVKLLVRLICTENPTISNKIVRGTNKQNQVLDEDFEVTLPFHQDVLEPFFLAIDHEPHLFYERRAKQYNGSSIPTTRIVNLRILCQTFTAVFLNAPHDAYRHQKVILEKYGGEKFKRKIFREEHSEYPYYVCAVLWYMFEKYIYEKDYKDYEPFRWHLYLIFRLIVGEDIPKLNKGYKIESYCKKFLDLLKESNFEKHLKNAIIIFENARSRWANQGKSIYGIKDIKEFTDLLLVENSLKKINKEEVIEQSFKGKIIRLIPKNSDLWYGFIESPDFELNIYFDSRSHKGNMKTLKPNQNVEFTVLQIKNEKATAKEVKLF